MVKTDYPTMYEVFNNYETLGGIFNNSISYPWSSTIDNSMINDMYFSEYGECLAGSYILNCLKDNDTLDVESRSKISSIIAYRFMTKWSKLWDTLFFEYNPIHNYDMTEEENTDSEFTGNGKRTGHSSDDRDLSRTLNTQIQNSINDSHNETNTQTFNNTVTINDNTTVTTDNTLTRNMTDTKNEETTNTVDYTDTINKSVYGFNSQTASPSDTTVTSKDGSDTNTTNSTISYTGTETTDNTTTTTGENTNKHTGTITNDIDYTNEGTNTTTNTGTITDSDVNNSEYTDTDTQTNNNIINRKLSRSGNIGVTTTQQMIQSERNLWFWDYFKEVFSDVNKLSTLPIF